MISPLSHALRYRIWAYASPRGWDCTTVEIAEAMGTEIQRVRAVIAAAGWSQRLRVAKVDDFRGANSSDLARAMTIAGSARHIARDIVAGRIGVGP